MKRLLVSATSGGALFGAMSLVAFAAVAEPAVVETPPVGIAATCPDFLPDGTRCWSGQGPKGGYYWTAIPSNWNGVLVVHSHGGPRTAQPKADDPLEDLERFSMTVREGYAWTGSTYRRGGYGVRMAAEDTNDVRQVFWDMFGRPRRTVLHGQSWGANVAAKAAELYARDAEGQVVWDGVVLSSGVLAGGTEAYRFRADLRAVYQYYCQNHPAQSEAPYPLWQGLPEGVRMTRAQLAERVQTCTGAGLPQESRTPDQQRRLADILNVVGIGEKQLVAHLAWGTFLFQDLVQKRLDGLNPFDNTATVYSGSHDDVALNAGVERFSADPMAVARLSYDADLSGMIVAPTVTIHGKYDPTAFVWHQAAYRDSVDAAGRSDLLVQTFTDESEHSALSAPQYVAVFEALMLWLDQGLKPEPSGIADLCEAADARYAKGCHFDTDFVPVNPLAAAR